MYLPLADRVLVNPFDPEDKSPGGIIIPTTGQEGPLRGEVVAVGPGRVLDNGTLVPVNVQVGDVVIYPKYAGQEVRGKPQQHAEIEDMLIMHETDIMAVVRE